MKFIRAIFFPFSILYGWLMHIRNRQFDNGQRRQTMFDKVVISVGNLSTGGTGKTPMIEYLIRNLKDRASIATISRGYGRKTKGFRLATVEDTAATIGDEPLQFFRKFGQEITVSVGEERILAIPSVLMTHAQAELFLLDDAFQHRKVGRDLDIVLSDYSHPFYKDYVLPSGNLREPRSGARRAHAIVVTKCPVDLNEGEKEDIRKEIRRYNAKAPIYFSHISYMPLRPVFSEVLLPENIVLLTGIAKTKPILKHLTAKHKVVRHLSYPDHYNFRSRDLDDMEKTMTSMNTRAIVTTEKDMVRLLPFKSHSIFQKNDLFYLPIEFQLDAEELFLKQLIETIEKSKNVN